MRFCRERLRSICSSLSLFIAFNVRDELSMYGPLIFRCNSLIKTLVVTCILASNDLYSQLAFPYSDGVYKYINLNSAKDHSLKQVPEDPVDAGTASPNWLKHRAFQVRTHRCRVHRASVQRLTAQYGRWTLGSSLKISYLSARLLDLGDRSWKRCPGLMRDIESCIYVLLLEYNGYVPKHKMKSFEDTPTALPSTGRSRPCHDPDRATRKHLEKGCH